MIDKIKKIILVLILTLLIWGWAFNAIVKETEVPIILDISAANSDLLVSFVGTEATLNIAVTFKGPASTIKKLEQDLTYIVHGHLGYLWAW